MSKKSNWAPLIFFVLLLLAGWHFLVEILVGMGLLSVEYGYYRVMSSILSVTFVVGLLIQSIESTTPGGR